MRPPAPKFGEDSPLAPNFGGGEETDAAAESFLTPSGETQPPSDTTAVPAVASFPKPPFAPTWSLTHPFFGIQFVLIAVNVIAVALLPLFYVVANLRHLPQDQILQAAITNVTIVALLIQNVLFVVVVGYYLRRYGLTLADIGLGRPTSRQIALGIGIGASMFLVSALLEMALSHAISPTDIKHLQKITESVDAGAMFQKLPSVWSKLLFAFGGAVLAPIGEEVFFRGLLYNALKRRWNVPAGIVVSGLAFAVIHFNPLSLIVIFCMGMLLAYVYERTNSLWVTIMMHAMNNGAAFAITWFFPALGK